MFNENADPPAWLAPGCDRTLTPVQAAFAFATLGRLVSAIFERSEGTLVLSRHNEDGEDGEFALAFTGAKLKVQLSRLHLAEAFEKAIDFKREKRCHGPCKRMLPIEAFARCRTTLDGRLYRCRQCEGARLEKYYLAKKLSRYRSSQSKVAWTPSVTDKGWCATGDRL